MIKFESTVPTQPDVGFGVVCFIAGAAFKEIGRKYLIAYLSSCKLLGKQPSWLALALAQVVSIATEVIPQCGSLPQPRADNEMSKKLDALISDLQC